MEAIDIVEALNQHHEQLGLDGQFILHESIEPNETVKAYKTICFTVWFKKGNNKVRAIIVSSTGRLVTDRELDTANKTMNIELTKEIFKFISGNNYMKIVYGI